MIELSLYIWTEITIEFFIKYKPVLEKMEDLLKSNLRIIVFVLGIPPKKPTLVRFFERAYKIRAMTIFLALAMLIFKHPSLNLT